MLRHIVGLLCQVLTVIANPLNITDAVEQIIDLELLVLRQ